MSNTPSKWRVWFKPDRHRGDPEDIVYTVVVEAATERDALLASFAVRDEGDILVLPVPADPNHPRSLECEPGRGRHGCDRRLSEPAALRLGRSFRSAGLRL